MVTHFLVTVLSSREVQPMWSALARGMSAMTLCVN
jgi:hypothetical protein